MHPSQDSSGKGEPNVKFLTTNGSEVTAESEQDVLLLDLVNIARIKHRVAPAMDANANLVSKDY